jgi:hypothetical protein
MQPPNLKVVVSTPAERTMFLYTAGSPRRLSRIVIAQLDGSDRVERLLNTEI